MPRFRAHAACQDFHRAGEAARRDVRRDEEFEGPPSELLHDLVPLHLAQISVKPVRGVSP